VTRSPVDSSPGTRGQARWGWEAVAGVPGEGTVQGLAGLLHRLALQG
jgi:hypothetical protein